MDIVKSLKAFQGGKSVGVPGELAGMIFAHDKFGQLAWSELFAPVIQLAEEGWQLDQKDCKSYDVCL